MKKTRTIFMLMITLYGCVHFLAESAAYAVLKKHDGKGVEKKQNDSPASNADSAEYCLRKSMQGIQVQSFQ